MTVEFRAHVAQRWWISSGVIAAVVLISGVGFCLFDVDHGGRLDHEAQLDLCHALLASTLTLSVLIGLAVRPTRRNTR